MQFRSQSPHHSPPACSPDVDIRGFCLPGFEGVAEAMRANMRAGQEIGASFAMQVDGRLVVDIWAGHQDPAKTRAWEQDTLVCVRSVTKAVSATCILMLVDRGVLELEAPVARYWSGCGRQGKSAITVAHLLSQTAGIPYLDALPARGGFWDPDRVCEAIEAQQPQWPAGTVPCYHSFSIGLIYQELMRRVDGRTVGKFLREEVSQPFGIEFHIGLKPEEDARRAQWVPDLGAASWASMKGIGDSPMVRAWQALPLEEDGNSPAYRFNEFPSGNGHSNARAMARLFGILARGGHAGGRQLLSEALLARASAECWDATEYMTRRPFRYGLGYMLSCPPFPFGGHRANFGHVGTGGAFGFADPVRALSMAYCGNRMAPVADQGPNAARLIEAAYACHASPARSLAIDSTQPR